MLRLLKLPEPVKACIRAGELTAGHARALIGDAEPEALAQEIIARGLNVRQVEALVRARANKNGRKQTTAITHAPHQQRMPIRSRQKSVYLMRSGWPSASTQRRGGSGTLSIRYRNDDQLDDVLRRLEKRH